MYLWYGVNVKYENKKELKNVDLGWDMNVVDGNKSRMGQRKMADTLRH